MDQHAQPRQFQGRKNCIEFLVRQRNAIDVRTHFDSRKASAGEPFNLTKCGVLILQGERAEAHESI